MSNSNRFQCITGHEVTERYMSHCLKIDQRVYSEIYQGTWDLCLTWFKKNPFIYTLIIDTTSDIAIGYINAMPIVDELYRMIVQGQSLDTEISPDYILSYENNQTYTLYLCSLAVDPDYQNTSVFPILYNAFLDNLQHLKKRGIHFKEIIAEAVTKDGVAFFEKNNFNKILITPESNVIYQLKSPLSMLQPLPLKKLYDNKGFTRSSVNQISFF